MVNRIKVLSVGSLGRRNEISIFRKEQGESLKKLGINIDYFNIKGHGFFCYLKNLPVLRKKIKEKNYDLIHAHYGLSGLLSVLQRMVPVVITFHGSDIWQSNIRKISLVASYFSRWNIFISKNLRYNAKCFRKRKSSIIPCGIDLKKFFPVKKLEARKALNMEINKNYVLFSSSFSNKIKNYPLAKEAIKYTHNTKLMELKGYNKKEVNLLMNACDLLLVTSFKESGPLVVKEAMACNLPIVSTNVGDVQEVISDTEGCFITKYDLKDVAEKIKKALNFGKKTSGREKVRQYEMNSIAERIKVFYLKALEIENIR